MAMLRRNIHGTGFVRLFPDVKIRRQGVIISIVS